MKVVPITPGIRIDVSWKYLLTQFFEDFIAFSLPAAYLLVDWNIKPQFLDKELSAVVQPSETGALFVDTLVKVTLKNGNETKILIHIEIQGQTQIAFPERMVIYHSRLFDKHRIPITSLAIFLDGVADWKPNYYERKTLGTELTFTYPIVKLTDYIGKEAILREQNNVFAYVMLNHLALLAQKKTDLPLVQVKVHLIRLLLKAGFEKTKVAQLLKFLDLLIALSESQALEFKQSLSTIEEFKEMEEFISSTEQAIYNVMYRELAAKLHNEIEAKLHNEIEAKLHNEIEAKLHNEQVAVAEELLTQKFGPLPESAMKIIKTTNQRGLFNLIQRSATASRLDELFDA